uniref:Enoyl reductase (ER) domain-containing protein n=1 Tax=viral metagenome TaxID=1070528 RepID=A0A6C0AWB0_9ZZZZ|tara:strand:- start:10996 stop:12123 length:1128 start_codon:yes stop_codon:yes gene_type:complete
MSRNAFRTTAWAIGKAGNKFEEYFIYRRPVGNNDVHIAIKYAGICHSDIHQANGEWGTAIYPMIPGHEIAGIVAAVGKNVTKFKVGDHAGIGCMVDSCRNCSSCANDQENYCEKGAVLTYNSRMKFSHCPGYSENPEECEPTYGGYSKDIVCDERFVCLIPKNIPLENAPPLLCAGITVYSPFVYYGVKKGMRIGVAGLGGLGSMAVKFAKAFGCVVTVFSRGVAKKEEALNKLGADFYIDSTSTAAAEVPPENDIIIDTISANHDLSNYIRTLKVNGKIIILGAPSKPFEINAFDLLMKRKSICGSLIGGMRETQEMLDFCGTHNLYCDVEICKPNYINEAYDRTVKGDVRWRFCIDVNAESVPEARGLIPIPL